MGNFPVYVRRFGKFKIAGFGRTKGEALSIGKYIAGGTLAATFKVPGIKPKKIKGFKTKKTKRGFEFIEFPKFRLNKKTEVKEIQGFKKKKKKKKGIFDLY